MLTSSAVTARLLASITGANMIESAGGGNLTKLRQSNSRYLTRDRKCSENRHGRARAKVIICKRAAIVTALKAFNKPEKSSEQRRLASLIGLLDKCFRCGFHASI
jgi:hypothetical protein